MLKFRKADSLDIALLRSLAREIWVANYRLILSPEQIEYMLGLMYSAEVIGNELREGILWEVVEQNQSPIGFIAITFQNEKAKLNKLYLKSEVHGHGYGQISLAHVMDVARAQKADTLLLTVNKNNEKAVKAYEKAGFNRVDSKVFDIGNGYVMDDYIYSISL